MMWTNHRAYPLRSVLRIFAVLFVLWAAPTPAAGHAPALETAPVPALAPDPPLQSRIVSLFGAMQGTVIVYDLPSRTVVAVTNPRLAFSSLSPPGSLMKLVTALALLEAHRILPAETVCCTNHLQVDGDEYTCGVDGGHGQTDLRHAIAKSCSIYFYTMGQRLSFEQLRTAARDIGIGASSPFPAGVKARLTTPRSARERTLMLVGEGGAVRITPWDAVEMVARIHDAPHENPVLRVLRESTRDAVVSGTARPANVPGIEVCGKTGTATWLDATPPDAPPRTHGWFAGTAGRVAVTVFLKTGTGHDAAAVAGRVIRICKELRRL